MKSAVCFHPHYGPTMHRKLYLFIDTTFAPSSKIFSRIKESAPELNTLVFISLSKSVSRGLTKAGTVISGS